MQQSTKASSVEKVKNFSQLPIEISIPANTNGPAAIIHFPTGAKLELYNPDGARISC